MRETLTPAKSNDFTHANTRVGGRLLQRKCDCGRHTIGGGTCDKCGKKGTLQRRPDGRASGEGVPDAVRDAIRTSGRPLDPDTRTFMESRLDRDFSRVPVSTQSKLVVGEAGDHYEQEADRMAERAVSEAEAPRARRGTDFGGVRLHTDAAAAEAAHSVGARAFTLGHDIFFAHGEYDPLSSGGRRLLAHELAHVGQQGGASSLLQRSLTVVDPGAQTPNIPPPWATMTNAQMVQQWLNELCNEGLWSVNSATGVVSSSIGNTFCAATTQIPYNHHTLSGHPTSCGCLCELTAVGSKDISLHAADSFVVSGSTIDVRAAGEGATTYPSGASTEYHSGISGREYSGITGVGDTRPLAGANPTQTLRDPPWIIFGHEVCGHARLQTTTMGPTKWQHAQTPEGNLGAVDIENRIRREHSSALNSYGIRRGSFRDSAGSYHDGSVYQSAAGETLATIATRVGLSAAQILTHIFRVNGDAVTAATQNTLAANERLLVEGIYYHDVMAGETAASIASMWSIPEASLRRANPALAAAGSQPSAGQRLLIPAS